MQILKRQYQEPDSSYPILIRILIVLITRYILLHLYISKKLVILIFINQDNQLLLILINFLKDEHFCAHYTIMNLSSSGK